MNSKQLISMWAGIILISTYGIFLVFDRARLAPPIFLNFLLLLILVILITGGFIITFKNESKD